MFFPAVGQTAGSIFDLDTTEKRFYWGLNIGSVKEIDVDVGVGVLGWDMTNLLSFEIHAGKSSTFREEIGGLTKTFETDYLAAGFVRANYRKERINLYALAGISTISVTGAVSTLTLVEDTYVEPGYGVGVELYGSRNTAFTLSWIRYMTDIDGTGIDFTTTNIGFIHHFDWPSLGRRY